MALVWPVTAAARGVHFECRASKEVARPRPSSTPPTGSKIFKLPPRIGPLFWPWEKVKVGPLSVSPMGFGTWAWGNQLLWGYREDMDTALQEVFNLALRNGITLFDTADSYGTGRLNGQSERLLGKFIGEFQGPSIRNNIVIATKFAAYPWRLTAAQFVKACKSSLERLQLDQIGIGQLHWSTANYAPLQEKALWDGLVAMYEEGLVRAVGVSNYGPKQLIKIHDYLESRGVPLSSAQVQFSLLSMSEAQMELKQVCDSLGICLIAYSPLGLGMLTGKYTAANLPPGPRALLFRQVLPGLVPLLNSLKNISERRQKTMSQVAINWCICKGTVPIPGVKSVGQAKENLGALGWRLSSDEVLELESAAMSSSKKMIQNIFQTK
ncbi:pyridoxal reductase, chloroplastic-like [Zingiber officinale]|uniref:pyridoxal reductase, chloroplastic-like n=1 Tax=Zingiber officinale TaxID=94328 RepID=UPI001C4DA99D|nr:pyridoxal reductase, chloroplastic-like [Zingiber officinale]